MIYSCFDPSSGQYDYYESSSNLPINADLPVPKLPAELNGIGVPAIIAGRPLPGDARSVGRGWHPRGMIVNCGRSPMGSADVAGEVMPLIVPLLTGIVLFAAGYYARKRRWF